MLIVGRAERVQFRGPGQVAAQRVVNAIRNNYKHYNNHKDDKNSKKHKKHKKYPPLILLDGNDKTDRYLLPGIAKEAWVTTSAQPESGGQAYAQLCSGQVAIVVLRSTGGTYDNPNDELIAGLVHENYTRQTVAGKGDHKTAVWTANRFGRSICTVKFRVG
jgi:hypothetical protein